MQLVWEWNGESPWNDTKILEFPNPQGVLIHDISCGVTLDMYTDSLEHESNSISDIKVCLPVLMEIGFKLTLSLDYP